MRFIDLAGRRFGKLLVLKRAKSNKRGARWLCLCDCGKTGIIRIMDSAHHFDLRVAEAVVAKMQFNAERPFKHGKKF